MNWKRIFIFVLILWAASYGVGFICGFIGGLLRGLRFSSLDWIPYLQSILMIATLTYVFSRLFRLQKDRGLEHAMIAAILTWLSSFPINVLYYGQPISQWFVGGLFGFGISIPVGAKIAKRNDKKSQEISDKI